MVDGDRMNQLCFQCPPLWIQSKIPKLSERIEEEEYLIPKTGEEAMMLLKVLQVHRKVQKAKGSSTSSKI